MTETTTVEVTPGTYIIVPGKDKKGYRDYTATIVGFDASDKPENISPKYEYLYDPQWFTATSSTPRGAIMGINISWHNREYAFKQALNKLKKTEKKAELKVVKLTALQRVTSL